MSLNTLARAMAYATKYGKRLHLGYVAQWWLSERRMQNAIRKAKGEQVYGIQSLPVRSE